MSCPNFQEQIALYVGGDILEKESIALEKHLAVCKACETFMVELQESQLSLVKFGQVDLPESAFTKLRASVLSEIRLREEKVSFWKQLFGFAYKWRYSFAASALFISISIPTYFFLASKHSQDVQLTKANKVSRVRESSKEVLLVETKEILKDSPKNDKQDSIYQENVTTKNQNKLSKKYLYKLKKKHKVNSFVDNNLDIAKNTNLDSTLSDLSGGNPTQGQVKIEKMEIQTSNPKIRIIWFVNKEVETLEKRTNG